MNKLTHIESQRLMAVLEEGVQRFHIFAFLDNPSHFGEELHTDIERHKALEEAFVSNADNKEKRDELAAQIRRSALALSNKIQSIHPAIVEDVLKKKEKPSGRVQPVKTFAKMGDELKEITLTHLGTTIEEEKSKQDFLADVQAKEQKALNELKTLQQQLLDVKSKHEKEAATRGNLINKLREEFAELKAAQAAEKAEAAEPVVSVDQEEHDKLQASKEADYKKLDGELEEKVKAHKKEEQAYRKKKAKTESEVASWVNKYDTEVDQKNKEIELYTTQVNQLNAELAELDLKFKEVSTEKQRIEAVERARQEEQAKKSEQIARLHDSARKIQRAWHNMLRRVAAAKAAAKAAKSKGKGAAKAAPPKAAPKPPAALDTGPVGSKPSTPNTPGTAGRTGAAGK